MAYVRKHNEILALVQDVSNRYLDELLLKRFRELDESEYEPDEILEEGTYVLLRRAKKSKVTLKWLGPFRVVTAITGDNFYQLYDITQDTEKVAHRDDLCVIKSCSSDEEALTYAQLDTNELTILEVLSHEGDAQRPATVRFLCKCADVGEPIKFAFRSCKYVALIQAYIKGKGELKPLQASAYYKLMRNQRKSKKLIGVGGLKGYSKF